MQPDEGFSYRLKSERTRLNLSQDYCAKLVGASLSAWKGWEKGRAMPADKLRELTSSGFDIPYIVGMTANTGTASKGDNDHTPKAGSKKYLVPDTPSYRISDRAAAALPDWDLLRGCIGALEELERYRQLGPDEKARAIIALYELSALNGKPPREQLQGAA